jgi:heptaprenyl diphosphate synthase
MSQPFSLSKVDEALATRVLASLAEVEKVLINATKSSDPFISEVAGHLAKAGGKRFRPLLVCLASEFGKPNKDVDKDVVNAAVVVELTHLATLYHDDVMDEAPRRRGTDSANARWDNTLAILTGDFLFAQASKMLADLGPEAVLLQAVTFERLVSGQIHETVGPQNGNDPVKHHIQVLADKTGSLIATSARFGGMFAELPVQALDALSAFGEAVGIAFQIADDILDITSGAQISGKTPGTDLREGVITLPMLMVQAANKPEDVELIELLGRPLPDDKEHSRALELMRKNAAMNAAQGEADRYATLAIEHLGAIKKLANENPADFADSKTVDDVISALTDVCESTANRVV